LKNRSRKIGMIPRDCRFSSGNSQRFDLDRGILEVRKALRTLSGEPVARRPSPAETVPEDSLDDDLRRRAAALMRVNHCGEVCAQALYRGQALGSSNEDIRARLPGRRARRPSISPGAPKRVRELGGRLSLLTPCVRGFARSRLWAGRLGERWNLGFLAETERQVEQHLQGHIDRLGGRDAKTLAVIEGMQREEAGHRRRPRGSGRAICLTLPDTACAGARLMTTLSHWI